MASVVGTMICVAVLMLSIGAQMYVAGLQGRAGEASQQAQQAADLHSEEQLAFASTPSGLSVVNSGLRSSLIIGMYLRYPNGSLYSGPDFTPTTLPASAGFPVGALVPLATCKDQDGAGTATCASRFNEVVAAATPGYSVGLLTSLGNTFWYTPAASPVGNAACGYGQFMTRLGGGTITCSAPGDPPAGATLWTAEGTYAGTGGCPGKNLGWVSMGVSYTAPSGKTGYVYELMVSSSVTVSPDVSSSWEFRIYDLTSATTLFQYDPLLVQASAGGEALGSNTPNPMVFTTVQPAVPGGHTIQVQYESVNSGCVNGWGYLQGIADVYLSGWSE